MAGLHGWLVQDNFGSWGHWFLSKSGGIRAKLIGFGSSINGVNGVVNGNKIGAMEVTGVG